MKIGGVDPKTLTPEYTLVLPRGESVVAFKARGLKDYEEFNKLCPEPVPPKKQTRDGVVLDYENKNFVLDRASYEKRRLAYMIVKSLEPSDIEWETVNPDVPGTWANWEVDLKNSDFSQVEMNRIVGLVLEANCLDELKLKQAREVFLRGPQPGLAASSGQTSELPSSPSGEPAQG